MTRFDHQHGWRYLAAARIVENVCQAAYPLPLNAKRGEKCVIKKRRNYFSYGQISIAASRYTSTGVAI